MNGQSTALPSEWVARLFLRFQAIYGNRVATMWGDVPPDEVRGVWADSLGQFGGDDLRDALTAVFDAHPDYPPTLPQFVGLCRDAKRVRAANATKLPPPRGVPCPPEIRAQLDATLKRFKA